MNSPLKPTFLADTDWGDDIDDALTTALLARTVEQGQLAVLTADETGDHRARGVAEQMRRMGRADVPVIRGIDIGGCDRRRSSMGLGTTPRAADPDMIETLTELCETSSELIWIGQGPMTNLAAFLTVRPDMCEKIRLTQMGGWLTHYRDPLRASPQFPGRPRRCGVGAAHLPLAAAGAVRAHRITGDSDHLRVRALPQAHRIDR
ncbi:nucleoside hydrolase [Nocardia sp. GAS34]|uniref:nucleoside hydrolase n=1 Tax=unclassified Nocardia TaxID=2637762 RepID=UPI003D1C966C